MPHTLQRKAAVQLLFAFDHGIHEQFRILLVPLDRWNFLESLHRLAHLLILEHSHKTLRVLLGAFLLKPLINASVPLLALASRLRSMTYDSFNGLPTVSARPAAASCRAALAIAMMVGGSASGTPPIGRVPWSRLDAHCGMDTVSFGSGMQPRLSGARALP